MTSIAQDEFLLAISLLVKSEEPDKLTVASFSRPD
jgi:hypothetical protein